MAPVKGGVVDVQIGNGVGVLRNHEPEKVENEEKSKRPKAPSVYKRCMNGKGTGQKMGVQ